MASTVDFRYINPEVYRHPMERAARERLQKLPGYARAIDMCRGGMGGKAERQAEIASMARVGPGVYPLLDNLWNNTQNRFGLNGIPLHIAFNYPRPWSIRGGDDTPLLVMDGRWLDELPEREMAALLAMQAGSIRLGNASYFAYADLLRWLSDFSGIAGAPAAVVAWGMENWRRHAAFSADRAAALALGDPDPVASLLARLGGAGGTAWGGVPQPDHLRLQGIEAMSRDKDWSNSRWRRFAMAMNRQNNVSLIRRIDLLDWFAGGNPSRILGGEMTEPEDAGPDCGNEATGSGIDDPGLAFWGEFAPGRDEEEEKTEGCLMANLMGVAEKGLNSFWKAGETFLKSMQDKR